MKKNNKTIEEYFADAVMGRPYGFYVENRHFFLYPVTLGKMYLLQRHIERMEINEQHLSDNLSLEAIRLAKTKREECISLLTYHTCKTKEEVFDTTSNEEKKNFFEKELSEDELATLLILILSTDKTETFTKHFGIDKESDRRNAVIRTKATKDKNNMSFGGKTVYGALIDAACERYGWTKDYVVWGIDYTSLRLMLADKVSSIFCSEEDLKVIPSWAKNGDEEIIRPTKENMDKILNMDWR